jgi:hypothetical protein
VFSVEVKGSLTTTAGQQKLTQAGRVVLRAIGEGLYVGAQLVIGEAKEKFVPVVRGTLRRSGYVKQPRVQGGEVSVELGVRRRRVEVCDGDAREPARRQDRRRLAAGEALPALVQGRRVALPVEAARPDALVHLRHRAQPRRAGAAGEVRVVSWPEELQTYLVAQGVATAAQVFAFLMPAAPDTALCMTPLDGQPTETAFGSAAARWEFPLLLVRCRGPRNDAAAAYALAKAAHLALVRVQAQSLSGTFYHQLTALGSPHLLEVDDQGRPEVGFHVQVEKEVS